MSKKTISIIAVFMILFAALPSAYAEGLKQGTASLLLPTTGQAMNGQLGNTKTKIMGGVEVASITAVVVLGIATGGASVLWGAIPLATNHVWSATDAYKNAGRAQQDPNANITVMAPGQEMYAAQQTLETSRQGRFDREQAGRYDIRERVRLAGEQANNG